MNEITAPVSKLGTAIRSHLLWEYDLTNFDFKKSADIVIERIIERGNMEEWQQMLRFYGIEKVLSVARTSRQLDARNKQFTEIFVHSDFNAL
ncbi:MAG: DUF6922 domain-containing protein [Saprospiraceae bacterium]